MNRQLLLEWRVATRIDCLHCSTLYMNRQSLLELRVATRMGAARDLYSRLSHTYCIDFHSRQRRVAPRIGAARDLYRRRQALIELTLTHILGATLLSHTMFQSEVSFSAHSSRDSLL